MDVLAVGVAERALWTQRRFYCSRCGEVAALCGVAMFSRMWAVAVASAGWAFLRTGCLKIGGRLFTASEVARRRDEQKCSERNRGTAVVAVIIRR